jgi:predicted DCC family thiol-disulfide oxidoreductase YuxK
MVLSEELRPEKSGRESRSIVFFDGVCGLCNRFVRFVLHEDRNRKFLFSPIQGQTFKSLASRHPGTGRTDSVFVLRHSLEGEDLLAQSDATLFILSELPKYRLLSRIGFVCPVAIRNAVYKLIATFRYKLWGRTLICQIPTPEEALRFLP